MRFDHFCYLAPHRPTLTNDAAQPTNGGATADQEALRGWWTGLIGSPCATLFITVLVLRLLTENRCDSMSYQRTCGPRRTGSPDNPISSFTLPKRGVASCVANLSRIQQRCPSIRLVPTSAPPSNGSARCRGPVSVDQVGADVGTDISLYNLLDPP